LLLAGSLTYGLVWGRLADAGFGWMILAVFVAAFNLRLSLGRPLLFRPLHGSMQGYRFVSGIPAIASFLVLIAVVRLFGDISA
jgi:hypothetical protein